MWLFKFYLNFEIRNKFSYFALITNQISYKSKNRKKKKKNIWTYNYFRNFEKPTLFIFELKVLICHTYPIKTLPTVKSQRNIHRLYGFTTISKHSGNKISQIVNLTKYKITIYSFKNTQCDYTNFFWTLKSVLILPTLYN